MQDRDGDRGEVAESDPVAGQPRIVAVVPALNEALSIEKVVSGLLRQTHVPLAEIIVVDNRSTDDTAVLARAAGARVVSEPRRGYGQACWAGVLAAEDADVIVLLDGDAADEPEDLPRVLGPLLEGRADLVVGSRALGSRDRLDDAASGVRELAGGHYHANAVRHRRHGHGAVPGPSAAPTCSLWTCTR